MPCIAPGRAWLGSERFVLERVMLTATARSGARESRHSAPPSEARIVVGGPHATALPGDPRALASGGRGGPREGEQSFAELVARLEAGASPSGIAGTAWRDRDGVLFGACAAAAFAISMRSVPLMTTSPATSCLRPAAAGSLHVLALPGRSGATSCAHIRWAMCSTRSKKALGAAARGHDHVQDETFTAQPSPAWRYARASSSGWAQLVWSSTQRADSLNAELVRAMRLAGCSAEPRRWNPARPRFCVTSASIVAPDAWCAPRS